MVPEQKKLEHLCPKEIAVLLKNLKDYPLHKVLFLLVYSLGLNSRELSQIRVDDIDFDGKHIFISNLKMNKRCLPLTSYIITELKMVILHRKTERFLFQDAKYFCYPTVHKLLKEIQYLTGVKINIRKQRNSIYKDLLQKGWKPDCIASFLGYLCR